MYSPDKVLAMAAKRRMFEESWDKLVIIDLVYILLLESSFPCPESGNVDIIEVLDDTPS